MADTRPNSSAVDVRPDDMRRAPNNRAVQTFVRRDVSVRGQRLIDEAGVSAKQLGAFMPRVPV
ncbi:hypothetical protein LJ656_32870 [Paraburkholderia sp. MMS20-SJTR3]|uniref:Uncharacterized protein n=1 Tax=Paraburkholderia sejongensis TaxID=2886946 RepID=A0ABS8K5D3_9BURK|nr:hypothetical protein [Paraburkholderia sp. MMS20-SJTR3]MCC8397362.1 hypothetical protein [Paraburkholderia sp. MMS20-SJTR3]